MFVLFMLHLHFLFNLVMLVVRIFEVLHSRSNIAMGELLLPIRRRLKCACWAWENHWTLNAIGGKARHAEEVVVDNGVLQCEVIDIADVAGIVPRG
jgi:hypothetical protein